MTVYVKLIDFQHSLGNEARVEMPDTATRNDLIRLIPRLDCFSYMDEETLSGLLCIRNNTLCLDNEVLHEGDRVTFFQTIEGG